MPVPGSGEVVVESKEKKAWLRHQEELVKKKKTEQADAVKRRIAEARERRELQAALAKGSGGGGAGLSLGAQIAGSTGALSAADWAKQQRKLSKSGEAQKQRAAALRAADEAEAKARASQIDSSASAGLGGLDGLNVQHAADDFAEGEEVVLTLADESVLTGAEAEGVVLRGFGADGDDLGGAKGGDGSGSGAPGGKAGRNADKTAGGPVLINARLVDKEKAKARKRRARRAEALRTGGNAAMKLALLQEAEMEEEGIVSTGSGGGVLSKYDEESVEIKLSRPKLRITAAGDAKNPKDRGAAVVEESAAAAAVRERLAAARAKEASMARYTLGGGSDAGEASMQIAREFYTAEEASELGFKKKKKKKKKKEKKEKKEKKKKNKTKGKKAKSSTTGDDGVDVESKPQLSLADELEMAVELASAGDAGSRANGGRNGGGGGKGSNFGSTAGYGLAVKKSNEDARRLFAQVEVSVDAPEASIAALANASRAKREREAEERAEAERKAAERIGSSSSSSSSASASASGEVGISYIQGDFELS